MNVIGFLCISPGSSAVQLHNSLGSRRECACSEDGFSSQNGVRAWGYTTEKKRSVLSFRLCKRTWCQGYAFVVYGGKCVLRKIFFTSGSRNCLKDVRKSQMMPDQVRKWLRTVKRLLCCGFLRAGKAMGQVYPCWWRICREINVFPRFEYHMLYVLYPFVTCLLTFPRNVKY
jgi:hypothetical protein